MALAMRTSEVQMKKTGVKVNVPNDPIAKLMYYLDCVCTTLELDDSDAGNISRLRNYNNYNSLSEDEKTQLLFLCFMISPDVLVGKVFFQSDHLCGDFTNEFYEIGQVENQLLISDSIIVGGQTRKVKKIMTFKMSWLNENYVEPAQQLKRDAEAAKEEQKRRERERRMRELERQRKDDSCVIL